MNAPAFAADLDDETDTEQGARVCEYGHEIPDDEDGCQQCVEMMKDSWADHNFERERGN